MPRYDNEILVLKLLFIKKYAVAIVEFMAEDAGAVGCERKKMLRTTRNEDQLDSKRRS